MNIKKNIIFGFLISLFFIFATPISIFAKTKYNINTVVSNVSWLGSSAISKHTGNVEVKNGTIFKNGELFEGEITIDMNTLTNSDIKNKSKADDLINHLKSAEFFEVNKYPEAKIKIVKTDLTSKNVYNVKANVTVKGINENVSFPVKINLTKGELSAKGTLTLDRTKFGIKYKSGKFFENLKDKIIHDDFTINFEIRARESK